MIRLRVLAAAAASSLYDAVPGQLVAACLLSLAYPVLAKNKTKQTKKKIDFVLFVRLFFLLPPPTCKATTRERCTCDLNYSPTASSKK